MALTRFKVHDRCTCAVTLDVPEPDAGQPVHLAISAACPDGCDLGGQPVAILDAGGTEVATGVLGADEDGGFTTGEIVFPAPLEAGEHAYSVVLPDHPRRRVVHRAGPTGFAIAAQAHETRLSAWDVPATVTAGAPFSLKVGIKCTSECAAAGRTVRLKTAADEVIGAATLTADIWPGTQALHFAEVSATAPAHAGAHELAIEVPATTEGVPHTSATARLTLNVVPEPEFEVRIEAVDRQAQTPIAGARVVMHPYRAISDAAGIARLRVVGGAYTALVSGKAYLAGRIPITVEGDTAARAELEREPPPPNPDDAYY